MNNKNTILLFDDDEKILNKKYEAIVIELKNNGIEGNVVKVDSNFLEKNLPKASLVDDPIKDAIEDRFAKFLHNNPNIKLVVLDRDLSKYDSEIKSESSISKGSLMSYVPVCGYSRRMTDNKSLAVLKKLSNLSKSNIIDVENDKTICAKQVVSIFDGFIKLEKLINQQDTNFIKNKRSKIISTLLKKENYSIYFENYRLSPILDDFTLIKDPDNFDNKRLICLLGIWMYKYVLSQPGIFLNKIACASFLNIDPSDFETYKDEFKDFKYSGPFGLFEDYWWRHDLESFLITNEYNDGLEFIHTKDKKVKPCKCSIDNELDAGYYCLLKEAPISYENSSTGLSWIQSGADLSRINNDAMEEIIPFYN